MERGMGTYRNKVLSSLNPSARARTASLLPAPKSRRANIARYRSKRGNLVLRSAVLNSGMDCGADDGAGSIVGKSGLGFVSYRFPCLGLDDRMGRQVDPFEISMRK